MTIGKAYAIAVGLLMTMAIGVRTGQTIARHYHHSADAAASAVIVPPLDVVPAAQPADTETHYVLTTHPAPASKAAATRAVTPAVGVKPAAAPAIGVLAPGLRERMKPLLNSGTDVARAADGFGDAEQFAAVAHAARNTKVPFMVLKYRVVDESRSLADAIHESQPRIDASVEADRALAEARSDIASLAF
jgi:hypothetical protein